MNDKKTEYQCEVFRNKNYKVIVTFFKTANGLMVRRFQIFRCILKKWFVILTVVCSILLGNFIINNKNNYINSTSIFMIYGGSSSENINDENKETNDEIEINKEARAMEALKASAIRKASGQQFPASVNKMAEFLINKFCAFYNSKLGQFLLEIEALSINYPPHHIHSPRIGLKLNPAYPRLFLPGRISEYTKSIFTKTSSSTALRSLGESYNDIKWTAGRRQPPFEGLTLDLSKFSPKPFRFSLFQINRKFPKHKEALLQAFQLPNNYFDQFKTRIARAHEVARLLRKNFESDKLLVYPNGTLNYRESVIHIYNPVTRLYVVFENRESQDFCNLITFYQFTQKRGDILAEDMKSGNWDGSVGESEINHMVRAAELATLFQKRQFREMYKEYFPQVAPTHKLDNGQITKIPEIVEKYSNGERLTPTELKIVKRCQLLEQGWQNFLDENNIALDDNLRNFWFASKADVYPSEAPSVVTQMDKIIEDMDNIIGPKLGDIE